MKKNIVSNLKSSDNPYNALFDKGVNMLKHWRPTRTQKEAPVDVLDFFSGCGGMSLGFAALSKCTGMFNVIGGVDINETALKSFATNFEAKTLKKDIREIYLKKEQNFIRDYFNIKSGKPLVIIGCAPCQGFSAHRKTNWDNEDERNTLIGAFVETILKFSPDFVVMENVPEILEGKYTEHYAEAKRLLEKKGYIVKQAIYNSAVFGVPQSRYRAVILASKKDFSLPAAILTEEEYKTVRDAIGDLPKVKPGEILETDVYHRSASHKKETIKTISLVPKNGGSRPRGVGPKCLDKVNGFSDVYGRLSWNKPSITLTQYSRNPASGRFTHPTQNRGLTIREAARLQSFPDGFIFEGNLDHCFKQIGESVPPLLSLAIATQISLEFSKRGTNPNTGSDKVSQKVKKPENKYVLNKILA